MSPVQANSQLRSRLVKILVWIDCAALIIGGLINFVGNILNIVDLTMPILSLYIFLFGCISLCAELGLSFTKTYFDFLHDWLGEGVFFIFVGSLGISFGTKGIIPLIVGIYSACVGIACIADHFISLRKLNEENNANNTTITNVESEISDSNDII